MDAPGNGRMAQNWALQSKAHFAKVMPIPILWLATDSPQIPKTFPDRVPQAAYSYTKYGALLPTDNFPDRLPNARRPEPIPAEELKRRSLEKVRRYLDAPAEEDVLVNGSTKAHRKWLMSRWNK
jgi:hypothetical protein